MVRFARGVLLWQGIGFCLIGGAVALWLTWPRPESVTPPIGRETGKRVTDPRQVLQTAKARQEIDRAYEATEEKDWQTTVEHLEKAVEQNPESQVSDWAQYQKGIALKASGDYDGAIAAFRELQRRFPDNYLSIRADGRIRECREARGDVAPSQPSLERLLGLCGAECLKLVCDHYGIPKQSEQTTADTEEVSSLHPFPALTCPRE
jgi:tetratricopeptide (TPR) repeat protein